MSIPLVQENTKDAINTSIIAIKRNIERINNLLGLSGSEEIDTSIFATKEELENLETALQPVDEVTVDNMQSVTSNAVARRCLVQNKVFTVDTNFTIISAYPIRVRQIGNIVYTSGMLIVNTLLSSVSPIITINNLHISYNLICQITYWNNSSQQYNASVVSVRQNGDNLIVATENIFYANDYIYLDISFLIDN